MRRTRFTKEGRRFLLAVALLGLASLNTGNNLIYLIFSLMVALLAVSFVMPFVNLSMLRFKVTFQEPLFAKTSSRAHVFVRNGKPFASYSVALEIPFVDDPGISIPFIARGEHILHFDTIMIGKRGIYSSEGTGLRTGFPFIFLNAQKSLPGKDRVIVYPEIIDLSSLARSFAADDRGRQPAAVWSEGEYVSTREYVYGEESRRIDWKSSAKMRKTMVKEFARADQRLATVILDNGLSAPEVNFEKAVSVAASLASALIEDGYYVRFITCEKVVPYGSGRSHLYKMLDVLAEVQQPGAAKCPVREMPEGMTILVSCTDTPGFADIASLCSGVVDARRL